MCFSIAHAKCLGIWDEASWAILWAYIRDINLVINCLQGVGQNPQCRHLELRKVHANCMGMWEEAPGVPRSKGERHSLGNKPAHGLREPKSWMGAAWTRMPAAWKCERGSGNDIALHPCCTRRSTCGFKIVRVHHTGSTSNLGIAKEMWKWSAAVPCLRTRPPQRVHVRHLALERLRDFHPCSATQAERGPQQLFNNSTRSIF